MNTGPHIPGCSMHPKITTLHTTVSPVSRVYGTGNQGKEVKLALPSVTQLGSVPSILSFEYLEVLVFKEECVH